MGGDSGIFEEVIKSLKERHESLIKYRSQLSWKFYQGEAPEAYDPNFDDSQWQQINLPTIFDARRGGGWFRCKVSVPKEVEGIEVSGSTVKLYSSAILNKSELFINGERVLSADYWLELRPRIILDEKVEPGRTYVIAVHVFPKHEPVEV
ncbi:MAG: hypothetical protein QW323_01105, partial [Candidatus Bathyarchaeia archaeon]